MSQPDARKSGTFAIGGDLTVTRLGFGAMRITGDGIWGAPASHERAIATLKRVPELGIDFIDTADSYGPFVSEDLIHEALAPYKNLTIATKGGLTRHGPNIWRPVGNPNYLRQCVLMSLRRLKVDRIDLWQLHRVADDCPAEEQFDVIAAMQKEGLIRHVGLSEVEVPMIQKARAYFPVTTVQNRFNLVDRKSEDVLTYCEQHSIGFIPWAPLAAGNLAKPGSTLDRLAREKDASPGQIALAWLLHRSPVMLPIPGTGSPDHLEDNTRAAELTLTPEEVRTLDEQGKAEWESSQTNA